jgi:branched-chain amino acid transport system permease protein
MRRLSESLKKNRGRAAIIAALAFIFLSGLFTMDAGDWMITVLRGLAVGAITFLVASGLSLIFGLMDVLNLAHGELFMLGAYVGWTVYVRPDTFIDISLPIAIAIATVFFSWPLVAPVVSRLSLSIVWTRIAAVAAALAGGVIAFWAFGRFPLSIWNLEQFDQTPTADSIAFQQGLQTVPPSASWDGSPMVAIVALILGIALVVVAFAVVRYRDAAAPPFAVRRLIPGLVAAGIAVLLLLFGNSLTDLLYDVSTTYRFFLALVVALLGGFALGAVIETSLIRPLYERPIYQLMITLGLGFIIIEVVREVWGRPEFAMPKPALFNGTGEGCPGQGISGLFSGCSTIEVLDTRVRMYNEVFIISVGVTVLVIISLLIKRTRMGMIIRAGVQDREMVEALGVNVRQVFTLVFALGVGLAAFGGVVAGPALGLSPEMGSRVLLLALIAMAVGGLTSFPGAAAGAVLVGLLQQFVIKAGSTGIPVPWSDIPFKPSPSLVPVSVIMLMIIVLLVVPEGLFGREE